MCNLQLKAESQACSCEDEDEDIPLSQLAKKVFIDTITLWETYSKAVLD